MSVLPPLPSWLGRQPCKLKTPGSNPGGGSTSGSGRVRIANEEHLTAASRILEQDFLFRIRI